MWIHIAGGVIALLSGDAWPSPCARAAPCTPGPAPGSSSSMLVLGVTAAILEPFRTPPGSPVGGIMVCYFVATSWVAARRRDGTTGKFEILACAAALVHGGAHGLGRLHRERRRPRAPARSSPSPAICLLAGLLDLNAILRAKLTARAADRASPVADVLRLLHRDRLLLPRPAGRPAPGGARLADPVRPRLRAVRGDGLLAGAGALLRKRSPG